QTSTHDNLEDRGQERRVHETMANPGDSSQLHGDDDNGQAGGGTIVRDQIGKRVTQTAKGGHDAAYKAASPGPATAGQAAVVGEGFREPHADTGAKTGRQAHEKSVLAAMGC